MHIGYSQSKSEAAKKLREKLEKQIDEGRASAAEVIDKVQKEFPHDEIVQSQAIQFTNEMGRLVLVGDGNSKRPLHEHALGQVAERASVPMPFVHNLMSKGDWGLQLLAHNFQTLYANGEKKKYLVRSINGQARGFLSDHYRRIDCRPIVESFAKGCEKIGAVPVEGLGGDTRIAIKALLPMVFEPFKDEIIAIGVVLSNSDFGNGALSIRAFILRLACINGVIREEVLRQVHLGGRLDENMIFSKKTYELDTKTMCSAVSDIMTGALGPEKVNASIEAVKKASEQKISDVGTLMKQLQKSLLLKSEADEVKKVFNDGGIEQLPLGQSMYRMSHAISWVAKTAKTPERRLELEQAAGEVMTRAAA
jgi:hypothetical protein